MQRHIKRSDLNNWDDTEIFLSEYLSINIGAINPHKNRNKVVTNGINDKINADLEY